MNSSPQKKEVLKTALITGSAQRLGKDLALGLAQEGYFIWVHYRNSKEKAQETLKKIETLGGSGALVRADLSLHNEVKKMVQRMGQQTPALHLLINNVGRYDTGSLLDLPIGHFENTLRTNLLSAYFLIQELLPFFKEGGSILNIGYTGLAALASSPQSTAYSISKTGLLLLTKSYASLLGDRNIRVNMISPGQQKNSVDLPKNLKKWIPLKRAGTSRDILEMVKFLASEQASYVTGQNIEVSGGFMLSLESPLK